MSKSLSTVLKPLNRYLTILPHPKEEKKSSGVLLPEDYNLNEQQYVVATILDISKDCSPAIRELRAVNTKNRLAIVQKSMIEEFEVKGKKYFVILENYILGTLRGINER